jgi:hypothetical protein
MAAVQSMHRGARGQALLDDGALVGFAEEALAVVADPQRLNADSTVLLLHSVHNHS